MKMSMSFLAILMVGIIVVLALSAANGGRKSLPDRTNTSLRIASHNTHYINLQKAQGSWSRADWARRKNPMDLAFKHIDADIFAFQEMESFAGGNVSHDNLALDWLLTQNQLFGAAGVGNPTVFPSTQPIFYRRDRLEVIEQGWFFFSDTPDIIYSRTFNGSFPAFASWAHFQDLKTGARFYVFNVHFEYRSHDNRARSIELTRSRIAPLIEQNEHVILLGDFNARVGTDIMATVRATGLRFQPASGSTYHFNHGINLFAAIDHIAVSQNIAFAGAPTVVRQKFANIWPSDHYPVLLDITVDPK